jgi:hypothetical protein
LAHWLAEARELRLELQRVLELVRQAQQRRARRTSNIRQKRAFRLQRELP